MNFPFRRWRGVFGVLLAILAAACPAQISSAPRRLILSGLEIKHNAWQEVPGITAGYPIVIRFEAQWEGRAYERVGLELKVDERTLLAETLEFRDRMGTFQSSFALRLGLMPDLPAGEHTLTLRCSGIPLGRGEPTKSIDCEPISIRFTSAGGGGSATTPATPPPPAPELSYLEQSQRKQKWMRDACEQWARQLCRVLDVPYDPAKLTAPSNTPLAIGLAQRYQINNGQRLTKELYITVEHFMVSPDLRHIERDAELTQIQRREQEWRDIRRRPAQSNLLYWDVKYQGMQPGPDTPPRPPALEFNRGDAHVHAEASWAISTAFGPSIDVRGWAAGSPFHRFYISSPLKLPDAELERIRARFFPVPPNLPPSERRKINEQFDAAVKKARQDIGQSLIELLTEAALAYAPAIDGAPINQAAAQRLAKWQPAPPTGADTKTATTKPPPAQPPQTPSSGVQFDAGLVQSPADSPRPPATLTEALQTLGEQGAERAAAIVDQSIPSAEGLSETEVAILAEAALTDQDPADVMADFAAEEAALNASGSGDDLQIVNTAVYPKFPDPGTTVEVTMTVRNTATAGADAIFDVGLCDYHRENTDVAKLKRRSLPPGETARYVLRFTAPRDFNFGGYAYLEPFVYNGEVLPQEVINLNINWNEETKTDEEIITELRDHNPCPDYFPLTPDRLGRFIALYRAGRTEALGTLEREAIAAQRKAMQAEYLARFYDPARLEQIRQEAAAAKNTQQLAAYGSLRNLAFQWGYIHHLDLIGILDDTVYIDENAQVHGSVAVARQKIFRAIEEKQNNPGAVQALLLADPNDKSGHTQAYREFEPVITPALNTASLLNLDDATTDAITQKAIRELRRAGNDLIAAVRNNQLPVHALSEEITDLRVILRAAQENLDVVDSPVLRDAIKKLSGQATKFEGMIEQAKTLQQRAGKVLGASRAARTVGNSLSYVGEIWSLYDLSEKVLARTNGGEDFATAIGKETGNWGAKKLVLGNPLIGAADLTMTVSGHLLKSLGPEYWEELGIDPTQYNASTLVDIGTSVTFAGIEDMSQIHAQRKERLPPLTPDERARLEARLAAFEERIATTTDESLRQKLMTARAYVRQTLRDRR
ncbi:hypothetical protein [Actomonas aquatica]|uniref:CARDB domain-containing protein n=1 Tax=Actomonas aquatica TaxID=2866162 RepID=A0ABZ1C9E0_9BACT|nr:hypothetical protein [Opitutus sp. WL0086]WRQ88131.1 hypothetical protein K1X11_001845 [Opitutus sp. WL0086]